MCKRLIIIVIALFFTLSFTWAQNEIPQNNTSVPQYKNYVDIGYNPGPLSILKLVVHSKFAKVNALIPYADLLLGVEVTKLESIGVFSVNYMRRINDWLWLGANVNYEHLTIRFRDVYTYETADVKINSIPIMAVGKAAWFRRPHVSLYSKVGIGATPVFIKDAVNKVKVSFQLTPIGVEFGDDHVYGFVEGGLGLQGVLIAGLRFPF